MDKDEFYARAFNYGNELGDLLLKEDEKLREKLKKICLSPQNHKMLCGIADGIEHSFRNKTEELKKTRLAELQHQHQQKEKEKKVDKNKGLGK